MGALIKSTAISDLNGSGGSVDHAVRAAEICIEKSGINKNEIDLLINTGIYRDNNIVEPAMATLIQKELGINTDPDPDGTSTFSFDLMNGSCGFLYAAQAAHSFIKSGARKMVLIVSSDVHPSKRKSADFPFNNCGSALILGASQNEEKGFQKFIFQTSKKGCFGLSGYNDVSTYVGNGRDNVLVTVNDDYIGRLEDLTVRTLKKNISSGELNVSEIDYFITSQPYRDFGKQVTRAIGRNGTSYIDMFEDFGDTHSSALCSGYYWADKKGLLGDNKRILFIGASSGLTVGIGLYVV